MSLEDGPGGAAPQQGGILSGIGQALSEAASAVGTGLIGVGNAVSSGAANDLRDLMGTNDVVNKNSAAYGVGYGAGTVLGFATCWGWGRCRRRLHGRQGGPRVWHSSRCLRHG